MAKQKVEVPVSSPEESPVFKQQLRAEALFKQALWSTRYLVMIAVIAGLLASLALFFVGAYDVVKAVVSLVTYSVGATEGYNLDTGVVGPLVGSVDVFLIAVVLMILSFGLYALFVSPIDSLTASSSSHVLKITSLDVLKDKLGHVILLAMSVKLFQVVLTLKVETWNDLLLLAGSIALVSGALFLVRWAKALSQES